jgi:hypothetical protein
MSRYTRRTPAGSGVRAIDPFVNAGQVREAMQKPMSEGYRGDAQNELRDVLLDNFNLPRMREAVAVSAGRALLEVSGGVTLDGARDIAATGVDRISIGRLTKDVQAVDYSMRVISTAPG